MTHMRCAYPVYFGCFPRPWHERDIKAWEGSEEWVFLKSHHWQGGTESTPHTSSLLLVDFLQLSPLDSGHGQTALSTWPFHQHAVAKLLLSCYLPPGISGCPWLLGFFYPYGYKLRCDQILSLLSFNVPSVSHWGPDWHSRKKYVTSKCNYSLLHLNTQCFPQRFPFWWIQDWMTSLYMECIWLPLSLKFMHQFFQDLDFSTVHAGESPYIKLSWNIYCSSPT